MVSNSNLSLAIVATFIVVFPFTPTSNADSLFSIDRNTDQLIKINPDSQQSEIVGSVGFNYRYGDIVWHPVQQKLLIVNSRVKEDFNEPTLTDFYWIDPLTAQSEHIGSLNLGIQASLAGYGVTIDKENQVYVSFTDLDNNNSKLYKIFFDPLNGEVEYDLPSMGGEVDNLEYDPNSDLLLSIPVNLVNPASIRSIDLTTRNVQLKCTVELPENLNVDPKRGFNNTGLTYDPKREVFWVASLDNHPLVKLHIGNECTSYPISEGAPNFYSEALAYVPIELEGLVLNSGLNDAWYNPNTSGQGFFITVFPNLGYASLAWFTYDTELPPIGATANLGDPGHRWITAVGPIEGNQVMMDIEMTSGGLFDIFSEITRTDPPGSDGTIILTFDSCNSGTVEYDIPSINRQGIVPIQRVANDNIELCEALNGN